MTEEVFYASMNRTQEEAGWTESTLLTLALNFIIGIGAGEKFTQDLAEIMEEERAEGTDEQHRYS